MVQSTFFHLRWIAQLCSYLDTRSLTMLVHAMIASRLDYCNAFYLGLPMRLYRNIRRYRIWQSDYRVEYHRIFPTLSALHWLPVHFCASFKVMMLTYKALNGLGPQYLTECLLPARSAQPTKSSQARWLRTLTLREAQKEKTRNQTFLAVAPHIWNKLPP